MGHSPSVDTALVFRQIVERDVDRAMVVRIDVLHALFASRPRVIRREHAANERDEREAVIAVIANGINVPPGVAAVRHGGVESQAHCFNTSAAAIRPDSADIATPGPGCALPPARKNPGNFVRTPER